MPLAFAGEQTSRSAEYRQKIIREQNNLKPLEGGSSDAENREKYLGGGRRSGYCHG